MSGSEDGQLTRRSAIGLTGVGLALAVVPTATAPAQSQFNAKKAADPGTGFNVKWFGAQGDATSDCSSGADDTAAIQAALDYVASIGGGTIRFPEGFYKVSSYLTVHPKTTIRGAGRRASVVVSAHAGGGGANEHENLCTGSVFTSINPLNSNTCVNLTVRNLGITNTHPANVGAGFYDRGGTFIDFEDVCVSGFKFGVVFDQSEIVHVKNSELDLQNSGGAGAWLVNKADLNAAARELYTNVITFKDCQFNQNAGSYGVIDDGGQSHSFIDCNWNGGTSALHIAGASTVNLVGGEFESYTDHIIVMENTTVAGTGVGGSVVSIDGGIFAPATGKHCVFGGTSPGFLKIASGQFNGATNPIGGASGFAKIHLLGYDNATSSEMCDGTAVSHFDATCWHNTARGTAFFVGPQSGSPSITDFFIDNNNHNSTLNFRSWAGGLPITDGMIQSTRGSGGGLVYNVPSGGYHRFQVNHANVFFADRRGIMVAGSVSATTFSATALVNAANDAAAATAGVPVNGFYRNGSAVMVRVT